MHDLGHFAKVDVADITLFFGGFYKEKSVNTSTLNGEDPLASLLSLSFLPSSTLLSSETFLIFL